MIFFVYYRRSVTPPPRLRHQHQQRRHRPSSYLSTIPASFTIISLHVLCVILLRALLVVVLLLFRPNINSNTTTTSSSNTVEAFLGTTLSSSGGFRRWIEFPSHFPTCYNTTVTAAAAEAVIDEDVSSSSTSSFSLTSSSSSAEAAAASSSSSSSLVIHGHRRRIPTNVQRQQQQHHEQEDNDVQDDDDDDDDGVQQYRYTIRDCRYDELVQVADLALRAFFDQYIQRMVVETEHSRRRSLRNTDFYDTANDDETTTILIQGLIRQHLLEDFQQMFRCMYCDGNHCQNNVNVHDDDHDHDTSSSNSIQEQLPFLPFSTYQQRPLWKRSTTVHQQSLLPEKQEQTIQRYARMFVVDATPLVRRRRHHHATASSLSLSSPLSSSIKSSRNTSSAAVIVRGSTNDGHHHHHQDNNNNNNIVGFVVIDGQPQLNKLIRANLFRLQNKPYIHSLMVDTNHRNRGLATTLITKCEQYIMDHATATTTNTADDDTNGMANEIWIHVDSNNVQAKKLYMTKCGYTKIESAVDEETGAINSNYYNVNYESNKQPTMWTLQKILVRPSSSSSSQSSSRS